MRQVILIFVLVLGFMPLKGQEHYHKLDYYMYLFAKNIEWPDSLLKDHFIIGVMGNTEANEHLQFLADNEKIKGREVIVRVFEEPSDIEFCHLLFIPDAHSGFTDLVLRNMSLNTLLITESPGQAVLGSGINIEWMKKFESIHFELNTAAFRKAGLKLSPELKSTSAY